MRILNLYTGIGGNRKLWPPGHEITAIENNNKIAKIYQKHFPNDNVIITDAHDFLLKHFQEYDFIWSSPPCQSHSKIQILFNKNIPKFPDLKLYEEILFLKHYFKGQWVVENTKSYYTPLIKPQYLSGHFYWSNFIIATLKENHRDFGENAFHKEKQHTLELQEKLGFNINLKGKELRSAIRNCVQPTAGLHVFNCAFKLKQKKIGDAFNVR